MTQKAPETFTVPLVNVTAPEDASLQSSQAVHNRKSLFGRTRSLTAIMRRTTENKEVGYRQQMLEQKKQQEETVTSTKAEECYETPQTQNNIQAKEESPYKHLKEDVDWKKLYMTMKAEYLALKEEKTPDSISSQPQHYLDFMAKKFQFLDNGKGMFEQLEFIKEMNGHIVSYTKFRKEEFERVIKEMDKM